MSFGDKALDSEMSEMQWARARMLRGLERDGEAQAAGISAVLAAATSGGSGMGRFVDRLRARGHWQGSDTPLRVDQRMTAAVMACLSDAACR